ncbi:MAG: WD40/YVTN/BNR-like repeat-containing protein [Gaiellaceae bacterium]
MRRWWSILPVAAGAAVLAVVLLRAEEKREPVSAGAPELRRSSGYFFGGTPQVTRLAGQSSGSERREEGIQSQLDVFEAAAALRAYPRPRIEFEQAQDARASFTRLPLSAAPSTGPPRMWRQLGPSRFDALPSNHTQNRARPSTDSGRVTALAIGTRCVPRNCRLWVGAAGGGVFRTRDALVDAPRWVAASTGLTSMAIGALAVDPSDRSGNTLYAGTGELGATADSEAGTGVFKTTEGGDRWEPLEGTAFARNRAVSGILVHPRNPDTIYVSTASSFRGSSSVSGGQDVPPDAAPAGVYRSTDGGRSFERLFRVTATTSYGSWTRDVNQIALDPNDPAAVYAAVIGKGLYRLSRRLDRDGSFHLVFRTMNRTVESAGRVQFALADLGRRTRIYLGDSDPGASFGDHGRGVADLYRLDDAGVGARRLVGPRGGNRCGSGSRTPSPGAAPTTRTGTARSSATSRTWSRRRPASRTRSGSAACSSTRRRGRAAPTAAPSSGRPTPASASPT